MGTEWYMPIEPDKTKENMLDDAHFKTLSNGGDNLELPHTLFSMVTSSGISTFSSFLASTNTLPCRHQIVQNT